MRLILLWLPLLLTSTAAPNRCADRCRLLGECTPEASGDCVAAVDSDCSKGLACTRDGRCNARDGVCVALNNDSCVRSEGCTTDARCEARDGYCLATSDIDCQAAQACVAHGRCAQFEGECIAASTLDCDASQRCAAAGDCGLDGGRCAPTRVEHCADSEACANLGLCLLADRECIEGAAPQDEVDAVVDDLSPPPIQLDGPLRRNAVRPLLRQVRAASAVCGTLTATVELTATVTSQGKATDIIVVGVSRPMEKCIGKAMKKARFPERKRPTALIWRLHEP